MQEELKLKISSWNNKSHTFISYDMDSMKSDVPRNSSGVACVLVAAVTFIPIANVQELSNFG